MNSEYCIEKLYSIGIGFQKLFRNMYIRSNHFESIVATTPPHVDVCSPNICGPYSVCHEINQHPVCSCQSGYIGMPPNCRAECVVSSDCPQDKACINQKCTNPCTPGTCAENAICKVVNHNPICSCSSGFTGDPFIRCNRLERKIAFVKTLQMKN